MKPIHVAVPTPFREDESLDPETLAFIIGHLHEQGMKSFLLSGSTGEQHSLSIEERLDMIHSIPSIQLPDTEWIFGVAATRTRDAVRLIRAVEASSVDAVMLGFPPYIRPTQREAVRYVDDLLAETSKPVILYNNPARTGFDLSLESLQELIARHGTIVGLKDAGDAGRHQHTDFPDSFVRFSAGDRNLVSNLLQDGCNGLSSIAANVFPAEISAVFHSLMQGLEVEIEELERLLAPLTSGQPIVNVKKHYQSLGMGTGICRLPLGSGE